MPGPGNYSVNSSLVEKSGASFSLRPNTSYASMFVDPTKKFPGPGTYNATNATDNKLGFTVSSKFRSPGGPVISRSGKRFDHRDQRRSMEIPGPGAYTANYK